MGSEASEGRPPENKHGENTPIPPHLRICLCTPTYRSTGRCSAPRRWCPSLCASRTPRTRRRTWRTWACKPPRGRACDPPGLRRQTWCGKGRKDGEWRTEEEEGGCGTAFRTAGDGAIFGEAMWQNPRARDAPRRRARGRGRPHEIAATDSSVAAHRTRRERALQRRRGGVIHTNQPNASSVALASGLKKAAIQSRLGRLRRGDSPSPARQRRWTALGNERGGSDERGDAHVARCYRDRRRRESDLPRTHSSCRRIS